MYFKLLLSECESGVVNRCFMFICRNQIAVKRASARGDNSTAPSSPAQAFQREGESDLWLLHISFTCNKRKASGV